MLKNLLAPLALVATLLGCSRAPEATPAAPVARGAAPATATPAVNPEEGLRVATRVGCNSCHMPDGRGGGMDFTSPQGDRLVAPNLTERRHKYDDAGLAALLREGKTHDGHRAFGMPIYMFQHLSDAEVRDISAWMRGLPAIPNPGLATSSMSPATLKQIKDGTFPYDDDDKPDPGNRPLAVRPVEPLALGRHLALTSCSECHGRDLNGWGPDDPTPSLVLVNKAYTPDAFAKLMKTGVTASGKTSSMSSVARERFTVLTKTEVSALKMYLDSR